MKHFFAQLRPFERRLVVGVMVVVLIVLDVVYIQPHFADWGKLRMAKADAEHKIETYQRNINQAPVLQKQVDELQNQGEFVPLEDQGINFMRTVQQQASQSGVSIVSTSPTHMQTNEVFFVEQIQNITVIGTDQQLVDFLSKLGADASMIRVRDLELTPDAPHLHLSAAMTLVASYQKSPPKAAVKK